MFTHVVHSYWGLGIVQKQCMAVLKGNVLVNYCYNTSNILEEDVNSM